MKKATQIAILSANYIASRLAPAFPVLYSGRNGRVAHECIIDIRPFKESCGVTEEDVAKRLIDFGFHSPTMSFPVPGTLMIEPTESEPLSEIDRFCEAMLTIREEIRAIEQGQADPTDNALKNAPHTTADLAAEWPHGYSREQAAYPGQRFVSEQVLVIGRPRGQRVRRPQPGLRLPTAGGVDSRGRPQRS